MLRVLRFLFWTVLWFVGLSFALVILYRFVPVPVTATMVMDENGITKDWTPLSRIMAAALPLPKERPVVNPSGFTRRYGNTIQARIGVVRRDGLDSCIYG